ncbi:MAG: DUF1223 domain-containing protein [Micavibrio aeruginosavorus]|uniref:DUF1223 domain-containing protein n=1 Tax=Micavibrio aeruginosavorus TaxID=349221 RepID=A0A7T5R300_9BACT|nr:MAG: DUF1223 domain-containing protein [Micavibrio aeruginosavorus]
MRHNLKLALTIAVFLWGLFSLTPRVQAEDSGLPAAAPVSAVESAALAAVEAPVVVELFSSQACLFCPQADTLFGELIMQPHVIGLACHVDYFDVRNGSLSQPFCTVRQSWYMQTLGAGPNYTPQMVINGVRETMGNKDADVRAAMHRAQAAAGPVRIDVRVGETVGDFILSWPSMGHLKPDEPVAFWLAVFDKPHNLMIAEGRNKGRQMRYENIVNHMQDLGSWPAAAGIKTIQVKLEAGDMGFALLAQGQGSGRIYAAGQYKVP